MNSLERVQATFRKEATDRVPVLHIGFSSAVASALLGREAYVGGGIQRWREATALWQGEEAHREFIERSFQDAIDIALLCDQDVVRPSYWRYNIRPTRRLDEYTFVYEDGPEERWRVLRFDPASEECHITPIRPPAELTLEGLEEQLAAEERAVQGYRPREEDFDMAIRAQRLLGDERAVRVGGVGLVIPLEPVWLESTALRPDIVARHLDVQVEMAERNLEFLVPLGFRFFFGGGDFASNDGPMYSPRVFHALMLPRLRRIADACHRRGAYLLFASDGDLWPVAEDLFGASGVDGYFEIDRRAGMDLGKLRRRFPHLTLIGNVSSHTVHRGSRAEVVAEALSCLEEARRSGGIVVGASNYFVPGTPIENVVALMETIRSYR